MPTLRPELEPLPALMAQLPIDARGYPVPAFVEWIDGKPDFRVMSRKHWLTCVTRKLCWVCGRPHNVGRLGFRTTLAFLIGPMCVVNRTTSEPPGHPICAEWSARNCPFMARPHAVRREDAFTKPLEQHVAGEMIKRNPGVGCVWYCDRYDVMPDGAGKFLLRIGDAVQRPTWWCEGRPATRVEVEASITSGVPLLEATLDREPPARRALGLDELQRMLALARVWLPRPSTTVSQEENRP